MIVRTIYLEWRVRRLRAKVNAERARLEQEHAELLADKARLQDELERHKLGKQFYETLIHGGIATADNDLEGQ